jgi:hypothetical protein
MAVEALAERGRRQRQLPNGGGGCMAAAAAAATVAVAAAAAALAAAAWQCGGNAAAVAAALAERQWWRWQLPVEVEAARRRWRRRRRSIGRAKADCNLTRHPCCCCCWQEKAWPATWGDDNKNTAVACIIMWGGDRPGGDQRTPAHGNKYMMRFNMQQRRNPQLAMCVRSILLELYKIQESAEITMVGS